MKLGTEAHKFLFCQSFVQTHQEYEPEHLPFPHLNSEELARLQGIPFWAKALDIEREAGAMVSAFAKTVSDPVIKDVIALQGYEETRHARLIQTLINHYDIEMPERPPVEIPQKIEPAFTTFGFEECLDSFFAFGLFGIAREAKVFPEQIFNIFDPILDEEARHIVFFVNWFTYQQMQQKMPLRRPLKTLWYYSRALNNIIGAVNDGDTSGTGFTATGAVTFDIELTPQKFISACLQENQHRMSKFDPQLLQPKFLPIINQIALNILQLIPQRQARSKHFSAYTTRS
jgi:hypothetical protein